LADYIYLRLPTNVGVGARGLVRMVGKTDIRLPAHLQASPTLLVWEVQILGDKGFYYLNTQPEIVTRFSLALPIGKIGYFAIDNRKRYIAASSAFEYTFDHINGVFIHTNNNRWLAVTPDSSPIQLNRIFRLLTESIRDEIEIVGLPDWLFSLREIAIMYQTVSNNQTIIQSWPDVVAMKLGSVENDEEGMIIIKQYCQCKADLHKLAQHLNIPIRKRDTIAQLTERIIESTITCRTWANASHSK